jgi:hypothetical protein
VARPNGFPIRTGARAEIPERVLARIAERSVPGAFRVPRSKRPCTLWLGSLNNSGHPMIAWFDADARVDRTASVPLLVYRHHRMDGEPFPIGRFACHTCDVKSCVSEDHVYLGDPLFNGSDRRHRGSAQDQGILLRELIAQVNLRNHRRLPIPTYIRRQADMMTGGIGAALRTAIVQRTWYIDPLRYGLPVL